MIVEFEKRIAFLTKQISEIGGQSPHDDFRMEGELKATEELYAFYKSQMVDKGRINPEQQTEEMQNAKLD